MTLRKKREYDDIKWLYRLEVSLGLAKGPTEL